MKLTVTRSRWRCLNAFFFCSPFPQCRLKILFFHTNPSKQAYHILVEVRLRRPHRLRGSTAPFTIVREVLPRFGGDFFVAFLAYMMGYYTGLFGYCHEH